MRDEADPSDVNVEVLALADEKLAAMAAEAGVTLPAATSAKESESRSRRPPLKGAAS